MREGKHRHATLDTAPLGLRMNINHLHAFVKTPGACPLAIQKFGSSTLE